ARPAQRGSTAPMAHDRVAGEADGEVAEDPHGRESRGMAHVASEKEEASMNAVVETKLESRAVTPMQMLQIAVERGADIAQLEKLMDLHERWQAKQARQAFEEAISAAKAEIKPIAKKREVDFTTAKGRTSYMYEDMALIASEVDPILSKYGLSYRYRSKQDGNKLTVTC